MLCYATLRYNYHTILWYNITSHRLSQSPGMNHVQTVHSAGRNLPAAACQKSPSAFARGHVRKVTRRLRRAGGPRRRAVAMSPDGTSGEWDGEMWKRGEWHFKSLLITFVYCLVFVRSPLFHAPPFCFPRGPHSGRGRGQEGARPSSWGPSRIRTPPPPRTSLPLDVSLRPIRTRCVTTLKQSTLTTVDRLCKSMFIHNILMSWTITYQ